jgi:hypothetical protein
MNDLPCVRVAAILLMQGLSVKMVSNTAELWEYCNRVIITNILQFKYRARVNIGRPNRKTFISETCCLYQGIFPLLFIISTIVALRAAQTGLVNVQSVIASSTFPPARLSYVKGSENKSHMIITSISPKKQRSIKTIFDTYSTTIFTPVVSVQPIWEIDTSWKPWRHPSIWLWKTQIFTKV